MIGFKSKNITIAISHMPHRKKLCLTVLEGNQEIKVATFNNNEAAEYFFGKMKQFLDECGLIEV